MSGTQTVMSVSRACEVLRVSRSASPGELRHAFRQAAKLAHPDRGGSTERFREVVEAHHVLQRAQPADREAPPRAAPRPSPQTGPAADPPPRSEQTKASASEQPRAAPPPPKEPPPSQARRQASARPPVLLSISPHLAATGGEADHEAPDGRRLRIVLPAGLRAGDRFRAEDTEFEVIIRGDGVTLVRGDDLWITLPVEPKVLAQGGRVTCDTPHGRRVVMISKKAAAQGLVRLQGQGLPPRGRHRQGHMYLRLEAGEARSAAREILRKLSGGWAA